MEKKGNQQTANPAQQTAVDYKNRQQTEPSPGKKSEAAGRLSGKQLQSNNNEKKEEKAVVKQKKKEGK